jgi:rare lipoprotein A
VVAFGVGGFMHFDDGFVKLSGMMRSFGLAAVCVVLASCVATGPKVTRAKKPKPTEYFAESLVGVKASPRVTNVGLTNLPGGHIKRLPRGGGRDMVGKPYKIRGKWYHPREDPNYKANGTASWYGDAFHGRLTANGEIYDMNNLTGAHPTMPLPSYARVTNRKNGKSVIVRVNDRGPYASDRLVDLSKRAAQLLDYTQSGTAQVRLEYIGRAPVHGQDDEYLVASYRENGDDAPFESKPAVMVASNDGAFSQSPVIAGTAFAPEAPEPSVTDKIVQTTSDEGFVSDGLVLEDTSIRGALPAVAPTVVNRPNACVTLEPCEGVVGDGLQSGYAPTESNATKTNAFAAFDGPNKNAGNWRQDALSERILVGSFTLAQGKRMERQLREFATLTFDSLDGSRVEVFAQPVRSLSIDNLVRKLWTMGFVDAFVVR